MKNDCSGFLQRALFARFHTDPESPPLVEPLWRDWLECSRRSTSGTCRGQCVRRAAPNQLLLRPLQSEAKTPGHTEVRTAEEGSVIGAVD